MRQGEKGMKIDMKTGRTQYENGDTITLKCGSKYKATLKAVDAYGMTERERCGECGLELSKQHCMLSSFCKNTFFTITDMAEDF